MANFHLAAGRQLRFVSRLEALIFTGLIALLFWAPLPFASNRAWAVSILDIWIAGLGILWLLGWLLGDLRMLESWRGNRVPLLLLGGWLLVLGFQLLPMPVALLRLLSPGSAEAYGSGYEAMTRMAAPISIETSATTQYLLLSLSLAVFFALLLTLVNNSARLRILCYALVISGTFQAVVGIYLHFTHAEYDLFFEHVQHDPLTGTFLNRNHFATYMEICLGLGVGLMATQFTGERARNWRQRLRGLADLMLSPKAVIRIFLVVMVMALIITRSRMGNAAVFSSILIAGVVGLGVSRLPRRSLVVFLVSMIVLDIVIIGSWIGVEQVVQRVQNTTLTVTGKEGRGASEESLQERAGPGLGGLAAWRDYPFFGSGGKTFYTVYQRYRVPGTTGFFDHAHMDYAEFPADGGALGVGFLALLCLLTLRAALQALKQRSDLIYRGLAFGAFMGLVAVGLHATVEFALQIPAIAFAFCVLVAVPWICRKKNQGRDDAVTSLGRNMPME